MSLKVLAFGTFDILHPGHLAYLRQASRRAHDLVVVIARDSTVLRIKGRKPVFSERDRQKIVASLRWVSRAVLGDPIDHMKIVLKERPDIICLGYDQRISRKDLRKRLIGLGLKNVQVLRLPPYQRTLYKSSRFRKIT